MVHIQSPGDSPVTELDVDDRSVLGLCQLGLHAACPRVQKLTLSCQREVTADLIQTACSSFSHLTELQVKRPFSASWWHHQELMLYHSAMPWYHHVPDSPSCQSLISNSVTTWQPGSSEARGITHLWNTLREYKYVIGKCYYTNCKKKKKTKKKNNIIVINGYCMSAYCAQDNQQ